MVARTAHKIPWNKGQTKHTHPSVLKISKTLASRPKSNFYGWQQKHKKTYAALRHGLGLAELYGVILGDGYIEKLPRTERLIISFNSKEKERIKHVASIVGRIFRAQPKTRRRRTSNCNDVYIYEKNISKRLHFPTGKKLNYDLRIPSWIKRNDDYLLKCLKGLFESDGNWTVDKTNYTSVISFRNNLQGLLDDVFEALKKIGYNPQRRNLDVRLARKTEVECFVKRIDFNKN